MNIHSYILYLNFIYDKLFYFYFIRFDDIYAQKRSRKGFESSSLSSFWSSCSWKGFNPLLLFFGASCMALSVGCRPTMVFYSLLIPVIILPHVIKNITISDILIMYGFTISYPDGDEKLVILIPSGKFLSSV